jgi:zinc transport system permease protein
MGGIANPLQFLSYGFGTKALIASALSGFLCASIGTYVVLRRMAFIGAGLAHIAFAGISFGLLLGNAPIIWGLIFSVIASTMIWYLSHKTKIHYDITIGILFSTSMGLAILFLGISGKYKSEALSYLFGSPLTVNDLDIAILITATIITIAIYALLWKEIYLTTFSEEIAKASGYKTGLITFIMSTITTIAVVMSMKAVGAILVFSLLIIPPASAFIMSKSYFQMLCLSVIFGVTSAIFGTLTSFSLNVPSGAAITITSFLLFTATYIFNKKLSLF